MQALNTEVQFKAKDIDVYVMSTQTLTALFFVYFSSTYCDCIRN